MPNEETIIKPMELPEGVPWRWYADCNIIGVPAHLDDQGVIDTLLDMQAKWRCGMIRVVA